MCVYLRERERKRERENWETDKTERGIVSDRLPDRVKGKTDRVQLNTYRNTEIERQIEIETD